LHCITLQHTNHNEVANGLRCKESSFSFELLSMIFFLKYFLFVFRYQTTPTKRIIEEETRRKKPPVPTPDKLREQRIETHTESAPPPRPALPNETRGDISLRSYEEGTPADKGKSKDGYIMQTTTTETVTRQFKLEGEPEQPKSKSSGSRPNRLTRCYKPVSTQFNYSGVRFIVRCILIS